MFLFHLTGRCMSSIFIKKHLSILHFRQSKVRYMCIILMFYTLYALLCLFYRNSTDTMTGTKRSVDRSCKPPQWVHHSPGMYHFLAQALCVHVRFSVFCEGIWRWLAREGSYKQLVLSAPGTFNLLATNGQEIHLPPNQLFKGRLCDLSFTMVRLSLNTFLHDLLYFIK